MGYIESSDLVERQLAMGLQPQELPMPLLSGRLSVCITLQSSIAVIAILLRFMVGPTPHKHKWWNPNELDFRVEFHIIGYNHSDQFKLTMLHSCNCQRGSIRTRWHYHRWTRHNLEESRVRIHSPEEVTAQAQSASRRTARPVRCQTCSGPEFILSLHCWHTCTP